MTHAGPAGGDRKIPERFTPGEVTGLIWKPLQRYSDARGWLVELFRHDDLLAEYHPAMAYVSMTEPGIARGPHEHWDQADYFCFLGPSDFKMYAWDIRVDSPSYGRVQVEVVGAAGRCRWWCRPASCMRIAMWARSPAWCSTRQTDFTRVGAAPSRWMRSATKTTRKIASPWSDWLWGKIQLAIGLAAPRKACSKPPPSASLPDCRSFPVRQ